MRKRNQEIEKDRKSGDRKAGQLPLIQISEDAIVEGMGKKQHAKS